MAIESPFRANEEILKAAGITDEQMKTITAATLVIRPGHHPSLHVEFALWEEKITAVAKAVAEYDLVRTA